MRKIFTLFTVCCFFTAVSNAQLLMEETFDYEGQALAAVEGDPLTGATNNTLKTWYKSGKAGDSNSGSLVLVTEPLLYANYGGSEGVKSVKIDNAGAGANARVDVVRFVSEGEKIKTGVLYYAFLLKANNFTTFSTTDNKENNDWRDVFVIAEGGSDVLGNSMRGRLFLRQDPEDETKIYYSISKNTAFSSSASPEAQGEITAGETYLFVIRQSFEASKVEVIVNPSLTSEPSTGWINGKSDDTSTFSGTYGIGLRRRNLGNTADVRIGGIRIAKTYTDAIGYSESTGTDDIRLEESDIMVSGKTIITNRSGQVRVFSVTGAEVLNQPVYDRLETNLNEGIYIVRFTDESAKVSTGKVIIK